MKKLKWLLLVVMFLLLTAFLESCASNTIKMFPITDKDIFFQGDNICMSQMYFNEVLQAKIEKVKR